MNIPAWAVKSIVPLVVCFFGWAVSAEVRLAKRTTEAEVIKLVKTQAPYNEDRKSIDKTLAQLESVVEKLSVAIGQKEERLAAAIKENTKAITDLRISLAKPDR